MTLYTIQGWRPTSVVIHPAISVTTDSGPQARIAQLSHLGSGRCLSVRYR
jgi:hypothetical protein